MKRPAGVDLAANCFGFLSQFACGDKLVNRLAGNILVAVSEHLSKCRIAQLNNTFLRFNNHTHGCGLVQGPEEFLAFAQRRFRAAPTSTHRSARELRQKQESRVSRSVSLSPRGHPDPFPDTGCQFPDLPATKGGSKPVLSYISQQGRHQRTTSRRWIHRKIWDLRNKDFG